jgi:hypothetical protein
MVGVSTVIAAHGCVCAPHRGSPRLMARGRVGGRHFQISGFVIAAPEEVNAGCGLQLWVRKKAGCSAFAGSSGHARETRSHENQPGQSRQNDDDTHDVDHIHCLILMLTGGECFCSLEKQNSCP